MIWSILVGLAAVVGVLTLVALGAWGILSDMLLTND